MTFVPDNAVLCGCWIKASEEERVASGRRNRPGPRGLASCERCHGVGFWLRDDPSDAMKRKLAAIRARALDAEPSDLQSFVLGITSPHPPSERT